MFKAQSSKKKTIFAAEYPVPLLLEGVGEPPISKLSAYETNIHYSPTGYPIDNPDERH